MNDNVSERLKQTMLRVKILKDNIEKDGVLPGSHELLETLERNVEKLYESYSNDKAIK